MKTPVRSDHNLDVLLKKADEVLRKSEELIARYEQLVREMQRIREPRITPGTLD